MLQEMIQENKFSAERDISASEENGLERFCVFGERIFHYGSSPLET